MTETAAGAVFICICAWITLPFTVPFTLQTFGVFAVLTLFGAKTGLACIGLYILMGVLGLPVFSGFQGGVGAVLGLTGGYIAGFILIGLIYLIFEGFALKGKIFRAAVLTMGLVLCYIAGTVWFVRVSGLQGRDYSFAAAFTACVLPYIIPDAVKMYLAIIFGERFRKYMRKLTGGVL